MFHNSRKDKMNTFKKEQTPENYNNKKYSGRFSNLRTKHENQGSRRFSNSNTKKDGKSVKIKVSNILDISQDDLRKS